MTQYTQAERWSMELIGVENQAQRKIYNNAFDKIMEAPKASDSESEGDKWDSFWRISHQKGIAGRALWLATELYKEHKDALHELALVEAKERV